MLSFKSTPKTMSAMPGKTAGPAPQPTRNRLWQELATRRPTITSDQAVLQAKLEVGGRDDAHEREADRVADEVVRMSGDEVANHGLALGNPAAATAVGVQRACAECDEEVARKSARDAGPDTGRQLSPATSAAVHGLRGGGRPLAPSERAYFEPRFAADFSEVRIHTDDRADRTAEAMGARAFTLNHDVAFRAGEFCPGSDRGRRLLAHELAHVVQQRGASAGPDPGEQVVMRQPSDPTPGPALMLRRPTHFAQNNAGCWASAIASWRTVKGLDSGITDMTLIKSYKGTDCTDQTANWLIGDSNADIEAVFGEWRLLLELSATLDSTTFTFGYVKALLEGHGHFVLITGPASAMHAMVVYGVRQNDKSNPGDFTLFVEDPLSSETEKHSMFISDPRVALGMEKSTGRPPCRSRPPR